MWYSNNAVKISRDIQAMKQDNSKESTIRYACLVYFGSASTQQLFFAVFFCLSHAALICLRSLQFEKVQYAVSITDLSAVLQEVQNSNNLDSLITL
jgi:hypothetical protein